MAVRAILAGTPLILATAVAPAASATSSTTPAGPTLSPIPISLYAEEDPFVINISTDYETQQLEKTYGLKFNFDTVPDSDVDAKQQILLASGDYPDAIFAGDISPSEDETYGSEGLFIPLNNLLKQYAPNVWSQIQSQPGLKAQITTPSGKIYALPSYNYCYHCWYSYNYFINVKYLQDYGLSMPTTTAQFAHVMQVFEQHGLVPITGNDIADGGYHPDPVTFLMNAFIPFNGGLDSTTSNFFDINNGKLEFVPSQPGWEAGLEYIHSLYAQGDIPEADFTQEPDAVLSLVQDHKVGVCPAGVAAACLDNYPTPASEFQDWLPIPPLKGPQGVQSVAWTGEGQLGDLDFAITNHASKEQVIRLLKLVNFTYSPQGSFTTGWGPEGKNWSAAKPGQDGIIDQQANWVLTNSFMGVGPTGRQNLGWGWGNWGPVSDGYQWRMLTAPPPGGAFSPNGINVLNDLFERIPMAGHEPAEQLPPNLWVSPSQSETFSTEQANIDNYVTQNTYAFITGTQSLSSGWKSYIGGLKGLGLSNYVSLAQAALNAGGGPVNAHVSAYSEDPATVKYLISLGPVPAMTKKYMAEEGFPASDFAASK